MGKMQYTSTQDLREEDKDLKLNYPLEIERLVEDEKISDRGYYYLKSVCAALEKLGFFINLSEFEGYIFTLPLIEQWLMRTEYRNDGNQELLTDADRMIRVLINNLPLMPTNLNQRNIDKKAWLELLDSTKDNGTLWQFIVNSQQHHSDLLYMIKNGLPCFPPYLPMTDPIRAQLKFCIEKIHLQNEYDAKKVLIQKKDMF